MFQPDDRRPMQGADSLDPLCLMEEDKPVLPGVGVRAATPERLIQICVESFGKYRYRLVTARLGCLGAERSSEVERSLMVRWVVGSILHGVDPLSYFSFQPVIHDWCNKGCGMYYPVCVIMHIKEPLLLIRKRSLCGGSGFPLSRSEWSITICLTPYNRK